jgi:Putative Ig domain
MIMKKILSLAVIAVLAMAPIAQAVCPGTLDFQTESLPTFYQGVPVNFQIVATGGTPGYTFTQTSGSLAAGLHLTSSGVIEGEPDGDPSDTTVFIKVTDSAGCHRTQAFAVRVEIP